MDISLPDINWIEVKKKLIKYYEIVEATAETVNWGYVGIGLFGALMAFYVYDTMFGSQIPVALYLAMVIFLLVLGFLAMTAVSMI